MVAIIILGFARLTEQLPVYRNANWDTLFAFHLMLKFNNLGVALSMRNVLFSSR